MEDFTWLAHLDGGEQYPERDARGVARGWESVPHERVTALELIPTRPDREGVRLAIPPGTRPALFRRRTVTVHLATDGHWEHTGTITVVGYESASTAHYWAAYPDGRIMGSAWPEAIR